MEQGDKLTEEYINRRLHELLGGVPALFARYDEVLAAGPATGSLAADDQQHPLGHLPWTHAGYAWAGAGDHANSYLALRSAGTQPSVGHYSLLRGVLEGAATARWILEPTVSAERIERGAAAELHSYGYLLNFERSAARNAGIEAAGQTATPVGEDALGATASSGIAEARIAQVKAEMAEHGVETVKVPSKTFLVDNYTLVARGRTVSAAWLYGLLSGLAHHQTWAIGASNLGTPADVDGISGSQRVPAQANMPYTLMATQIAIGSFRRALAAFADYLGR